MSDVFNFSSYTSKLLVVAWCLVEFFLEIANLFEIFQFCTVDINRVSSVMLLITGRN